MRIHFCPFALCELTEPSTLHRIETSRNFRITMPLYEYLCKKCGHRFEKNVKFSDKPIKKSPYCGGAVEQVLSAPAVQFKGSGWYVTDYAKKSSASSDSPKSDSTGKSEAKPGAKTESKAEAKTESKPAAHKEEKPRSDSRKAGRR